MLLILPDLFKKRNYNTKIKNIEDKIPNLATTAALNAKINEVKGKIPGITGLATTIAPNDVINQTLVPLLKKLTIKKKLLKSKKDLIMDLVISMSLLNNLII